MERFFGQEFPGGEVIKFEEARAGHEEELVKIVSLLMYLGTVKYPNPSLATTLQVRVHVYCGQNQFYHCDYYCRMENYLAKRSNCGSSVSFR